MLVMKIQNPLAFVLGILGNLASFMGILAPIPTFYRIYKKKSTESFQSIPYVAALFSALLWLYYAVITWDGLLLSINAVAFIFESAYLAIYITYAPKKARDFTTKLIILLNVGMFGPLVLLTLLFVNEERRINVIGGICSAVAVTVFIAPLSIIKLVIITKSVEYMPFMLSLFLTLSALTWFCYGFLLKDLFIALPNVVGFIFGMAQMVLYFIYMNGKADASEPSNTNQVVNTMPTTTSDPERQVIDEKIISEIPVKKSAHAMPQAARTEQ